MIRAAALPFRDYFHRLPTADLYFFNPLRGLRRDGANFARLPPTRIIAPNVYAIGLTGVIARYANLEDLALLRQRGIRQIVYLADDDFLAGASDPRLPKRYRTRLASFAESVWPALREAADIVVVPGKVLAEVYGSKARIMPPTWHLPPAPTTHFAKSEHVDIVHLGSGSHAADFAPLAPMLARLLSAHPNLRLTLFSGAATPGSLAGSPQVRVRKQMMWWRYRLMLPRMRFHLALYPLADSTFNRARSANKLFEHALAGAASLMSPNPALRAEAGKSLSRIFVEGDLEQWHRRIEADLSDLDALRRRAEAARAHILAADPSRRAAEVWRDILSAEL